MRAARRAGTNGMRAGGAGQSDGLRGAPCRRLFPEVSDERFDTGPERHHLTDVLASKPFVRRTLGTLREAIGRVAERTGLLDPLRSLRHLPDRRLHPLRRRLQLRKLPRETPPASVLFVCQGNIYRSPYAAAAFLAALPAPLRSAIRVESAGFVGPGRPSPAPAIAVAEREGLDLAPHRSSLLSPGRVAEFDWIVVMDAAQRREIGRRYGRRRGVIVLSDLDPHPIRTRAIRDPWDQPTEVLESSYARVRRCVCELAHLVGNG